jgi:hypothetical protein
MKAYDKRRARRPSREQEPWDHPFTWETTVIAQCIAHPLTLEPEPFPLTLPAPEQSLLLEPLIDPSHCKPRGANTTDTTEHSYLWIISI